MLPDFVETVLGGDLFLLEGPLDILLVSEDEDGDVFEVLARAGGTSLMTTLKSSVLAMTSPFMSVLSMTKMTASVRV